MPEISNGCKRVRDDLILSHRDYAESLCRKLSKTFKIHYSLDTEDFIQIGMVGLIEAADRFDPDKSSVSFKTYAYKRIVGSLIDACRSSDFVKRRGREKGLNPAILSTEYENEDGTSLKLYGRREDLDLKMDFFNFVRNLSEREQVILVNFLVGNSGREISKKLGITEQRVSQIFVETKNKLLEQNL